jgi:chemotaxis protein methyltransferase CheR
VNCPAIADSRERFRAAVARQFGLRFEDGKLGFLEQVLQRRLRERRLDIESYLWELEFRPTRGEILALGRELTVGETYFFRNNEQFVALAKAVLPERIKARERSRKLRLMSAGCSSGEEAYSIAMIVREMFGDPAWKTSIRAIDINPVALERAGRGRYSPWALRETPPEMLARWFRKEGREVVLHEEIRAAVTFEFGNLAADDPILGPSGTYDVIFCRNVLMYFETQRMRAAIARFSRALAPGGFLFLGHAETLRGISDSFALCNTHDTFYYRLNESDDHGRVVSFRPRLTAAAPRNLIEDVSWFDEIRLASDRVAALLPTPADACAPTTEIAPETTDLAPVFQLLRQERFGEALVRVRSDGRFHAPCRDTSLLEALLLIHLGQIAAATDAILGILAIDGRYAPAHYMLGLCREHEGAHSRAIENHRTAAQFDSDFAMPRLHLGLLLRRNGDWEQAQREFAAAAALLEREDDARILLFGGGFNRDALRTLCDSAMKECMRRSNARPIKRR